MSGKASKSASKNRTKRVTRSQWIGHAGEKIIAAEVATKLKWFFREQPTADIGIDGEIEVLKRIGKNDFLPTGALIKVQGKAHENGFSTKRPRAEEYEYWSRLPMPVIFCLVDLRKRKVKWFDTSMWKGQGSGHPLPELLEGKSVRKLRRLGSQCAEVKRRISTKEAFLPDGASKVAFVGQNLRTLLKLNSFWSDVKDWLQEAKGRECALVMQDPRALYPTHYLAAEHLRRDTTDLLGVPKRGHWINRVSVYLHPASTLSMTVVDWHVVDPSARYAVIEPKCQVDKDPRGRVRLLVRGETYQRLVGRSFSNMLSGATRLKLKDAGRRLRERCDEAKVEFDMLRRAGWRRASLGH